MRIEALSVDLPRIKNSSELVRALEQECKANRFTLEQECKANSRLLIHGIPCNMPRNEIKENIIH